jgi:hypothetical protein
MRDRSGHALSENDEVTLLRVTKAMVSGLPEGEAEFILSMEGKTVTVSDISEQSIEVMMTDSRDGIIHFLWVAEADVAKNQRHLKKCLQ